MTVKRTKDPAALLPARVEVSGADLTPERVLRLLKQSTPAARIERLRRHESLRTQADGLAARLDSGNADGPTLALLGAVEQTALYLDARDRLIRDGRRQAGTQKGGSRMPQLDAWLDARLAEQDGATVKELWGLLPDDAHGGDLYLDGDRVYEYPEHGGREKDTGWSGFCRRVTEAKKRARNCR